MMPVYKKINLECKLRNLDWKVAINKNFVVKINFWINFIVWLLESDSSRQNKINYFVHYISQNKKGITFDDLIEEKKYLLNNWP